MRFILSALAIAFACIFASAVASAAMTPAELRCEYRTDPLGIDSPNPRLSWILQADTPDAHDLRQTTYQILVASSPDILAKDQGDLWDSGKVASDTTNQIGYTGKELVSSEPCWWKVRSWDQDNKPTTWSSPARWTVGLMKPDDWQAKWIAAADPTTETIRLRRDFSVKLGLVRAIAHVCGLGQYEMTIDGQKVGEELLSPGWTKYDKTCLYDTVDLTPMLHDGSRAIELLLGNGMYNVKGNTGRATKFVGSFGPLKAIAQIRLEYADGSHEIIGTDDKWKVAPGPMTFCGIYGGEDYDARLAAAEPSWQAASVVSGPGGELRGLSCAAPPITTHEVFKPVAVNKLSPTTQVYDLGQNASIMPRITVTGPAGSRVRMIPCELVKPDGTYDRSSSGKLIAYWQYTLKGGGSETWFPKFYYHGSRYLQVEATPASEGGELPVVQSLEGVVVHSASTPLGEFSSSSDLFNRTHTLVRWAQRNNMVSLMTDCPHREKLGWLEQDHLNGPALRYEFDLAALFTKTANDMADSQLADGTVPTTAPEYMIFGKPEARNNFGDSPEWGSSVAIIPWQQYEFTGDVNLLRRSYDQMKGYVAHLGSKATDDIVPYGLGDWYDLGPKRPGLSQLTPKELTATAMYYYDSWVLAQTAKILGKTDEAKTFETQAARIRDSFNRKFYDPEKHIYATGSQCANSMPLVMNICEPANRQAVLDAIVKDVRDKDNGLTAGDVGYRYLLRALADGRRSDVIFDINNQSDKPGYGYQLAHGATSLTESWDARRTSSQDHFMLGQINEWFYHDLAGIQCDLAGPGFRKIIIKPAVVGDLTWVKCSYDSINGKIESNWTHKDGKITLDVTIPPNTTATVFVPGKSDQPTEQKVGSGHHHFESVG